MFQATSRLLRMSSNDTGASVSRGRTKQSNRKFGEIPDWAKTGPITLMNYDLRMEWYGAKVKMWGNEWPFLSHDPDVKSTANEDAWMSYFWDHLGGFPPSAKTFRDGVIRYLNVPESKPDFFDPSYAPKAAP